jgi:hypothetical protein
VQRPSRLATPARPRDQPALDLSHSFERRTPDEGRGRVRVQSDKLITVPPWLLEPVQIPLILKIPRQGENQVERFTEQMSEETI